MEVTRPRAEKRKEPRSSSKAPVIELPSNIQQQHSIVEKPVNEAAVRTGENEKQVEPSAYEQSLSAQVEDGNSKPPTVTSNLVEPQLTTEPMEATVSSMAIKEDTNLVKFDDDLWVNLYPIPEAAHAADAQLSPSAETSAALQSSVNDEELIVPPANPMQLIQLHIDTLYKDLNAAFRNPTAVAFNKALYGVSTDSEFYKLVTAYYDSLVLLKSAEQAVMNKVEEMNRLEPMIWTEKTIRVQLEPKRCGDNISLDPKPFETTIAEFNESLFNQLKVTTTKLRHHIYNDCAGYVFKSRMARIKLESYIDDTLSNSRLFSSVTIADVVQAFPDGSRMALDEMDMDKVKHMLDVLFFSIRSIPQPDEFLEVIKACTTQLVAVFLRRATYTDHLFLVRHLVACPNREWTSAFLQFPELIGPWPHADKKHLCDVLEIVLSPVLQKDIPSLDATDGECSVSLALTENADKQVFLLSETEMIALFKQLPFNSYISNNVCFTTGDTMDIALVFDEFRYCEELIDILTMSLKTFRHYIHLSKRICQVILDVLNALTTYVASIIETLQRVNEVYLSEEVKSRFDRIVLKLFTRISAEPHLWQFLVHLPYHILGFDTAIFIFASIYLGSTEASVLEELKTQTIGKWLMNENDRSSHFIEKASDPKHGEFLLHALSSIAEGIVSLGDITPIIVHEVFLVAYVVPQTRHLLYRTGRDVLVKLCTKFPHLISFVVRLVQTYQQKIGEGAWHLFHRIPFHLFKPTSNDVVILEKWLHCNPNTTECKLGQFVLDHLPWSNTSIEAEPLIGANFSRKIVQLLTNIHIARLDEPKPRFYYLKWRSEDSFVAWLKQCLLKPQLFIESGLPAQSPLRITDPSVELVKAKLPNDRALLESGDAPVDPIVAYYLLEMTEIGLNPSYFMHTGIYLLRSLVNSERSFAMRIIYDIITPLLYTDLINSSAPVVDTSREVRTYFIEPVAKGTLSFTKDIILPLISPHKNDKFNHSMFASMVVSQILRAVNTNNPHIAKALLFFWLREFTSLDEWFKDNRLCYLVNAIIPCAFLIGCEAALLRNIEELQRKSLKVADTKNSGIVGWLLRPLVEKQSWNLESLLGFLAPGAKSKEVPFPWLSLLILHVGILQWRESWMYNVIAGTTKGLESPTCPIFWQLFFVLYLTRAGNPPRFFAHTLIDANKKDWKREKLRSRLDYTVAYWCQQINQLGDHAPPRLYQLVELYRAMHRWLSTDLYNTISLNPLYKDLSPFARALLDRCFNYSAPSPPENGLSYDLWFDLFSVDDIAQSILKLNTEWKNYIKTLYASQPQSLQSAPSLATTTINLKHMTNTETPQSPPSIKFLSRNTWPHPVKENPDLELHILQDIDFLGKMAEQFVDKNKRHQSLHETYLSLIRRKYINTKRTLRSVVACNPGQCKRPVEFTIEVTESTLQTAVVQELDQAKQIHEPFVDHVFLTETLVTQNTCEVVAKLQKTIERIIALHQHQDFDPSRGAKLFYSLLPRLTPTARLYLPSLECIDEMVVLLARSFIAPSAAEQSRLLYTMLENEHWLEVLHPFFNPNLVHEKLIDMYKELVNNGNIKYKQLASLLQRFNIALWATQSKKQEQRQLIKEIVQFLNRTDDTTAKPMAVDQLKSLVSYQFPLHFRLALQLVIDSTRKRKIDNSLWPLILELPIESLLPNRAYEVLRWLAQYLKAMQENMGSLTDIWRPFTKSLHLLLHKLITAPAKMPKRVTDDALPILQELLNVMNVFLFPPKTKSFEWWECETNVQVASQLVNCLSNCLTTLSSRFPRVLDATWKWWIEAIVGSSRLPPSQQGIFNNDNWSQVMWGNAHELSLADMLSDLIKIAETYSDGDPIIVAASRMFSSLVGSPHQNVELQAVLKGVLIFMSLLPVPFPQHWQDFTHRIRSLQWEQMDFHQMKEDDTISKYITSKYNIVVSNLRSSVVLSANDKLAYRLHAAMRLLRFVLHFEHISPTMDPVAALNAYERIYLYIKTHTSLYWRYCHAHSGEIDLHDLFTRTGNYITVLLQHNPESFEIRDNSVRLLQLLAEMYNFDMHPDLVSVLHNATKIFTLQSPHLALLFLNASLMTVASEIKLPNIIEYCVEADLFSYMDWNRVIASVLIPNIGEQAFLDACLESNALLTLVIYCVQVLRRGDKVEINKLSDSILAWATKAKIVADNEWKLLLLWTRAILLHFTLANDVNRIQLLEQFANHILKLSEDKKYEGLLGKIGFGEKSPYPPEFRLCARAIATFTLIQISDGKTIRKSPSDPLVMSYRSKQLAQQLLALSKHEDYSKYDYTIQNIHTFIMNPEKIISDIEELVLLVASSVFKPPIKYLFHKVV